MTTSADRDLHATRIALTGWLAHVTGDDNAKVMHLALSAQGATGGSIHLTACWEDEAGRQERELVLRVQPTDSLFLEPDVIREGRILTLIERCGAVPVPAVLWTEEDPSVLGAPFIAMRHVDGRVPQTVPSYHESGWVTELTPAERALMHQEALEALAAVHTVPWRESGIFPGSVGTALHRYLDHVERWYRWAAEGRDMGVIEDGLAFVLEHRPREESACLCWGDARPGNMIFGPDLSVRAVIDWDMATVGPPGLDVGWWVMYEEWSTTAMDVEPLEGIPGREEAVRTYQRLTGRELRDLDYYVTLATLRYAIISARYASIQVRLGRLSPSTTLHLASPVTQMLARQLGLPVMELAPEFAAVVAASTRQGPSV